VFLRRLEPARTTEREREREREKERSKVASRKKKAFQRRQIAASRDASLVGLSCALLTRNFRNSRISDSSLRKRSRAFVRTISRVPSAVKVAQFKTGKCRPRDASFAIYRPRCFKCVMRKFACLVARDCIIAECHERYIRERFNKIISRAKSNRDGGGMERKLVTVAVKLCMEENVL